MDLNFKSLSIIVPAFNEQESLWILYEEIIEIIEENKYSYELIFVNDGSTDHTGQVLNEISAKDYHVTVINNLKKYGKSYSLQAGFDRAKKDIIVTLDADLQDDPREIPKMIRQLQSGSDMVCGWKKTRHDPLSKRFMSKIFNGITYRLSGLDIHDMNCGLKVMKKRVVKTLELYGELHRFIPFFASSYGFTVTEMEVNHRKRSFGSSKYGISRLLHGFFDFFTVVYLTKFQGRPLHIFGSIGGLSALSGSVLLTYLLAGKIFFGYTLSQRPLLNISILLIIIGVQMGVFGLLGEQITFYNARKHQQTKVWTIVRNGKEEESE